MKRDTIQTPQWFLDELAHVGSEHVDVNYVTGYDYKAGTDPTDDIALLRKLGLNETHTLVDMGAGTGTLALAAAPFCRRVVAVDVSPAMLTILGKKATQVGIKNIECVQAGFLTYEHQGDLADFVYSRNALHHLPDLWKALALKRIATLMHPGGILRLRDFFFALEPHEIGQTIEGWLAGATNDPKRGWTRDELETHMREEHSTFTWLLEPMLHKAGFDIQHKHPIHSKIYTSYICVRTD